MGTLEVKNIMLILLDNAGEQTETKVLFFPFSKKSTRVLKCIAVRIQKHAPRSWRHFFKLQALDMTQY